MTNEKLLNTSKPLYEPFWLRLLVFCQKVIYTKLLSVDIYTKNKT